MGKAKTKKSKQKTVKKNQKPDKKSTTLKKSAGFSSIGGFKWLDWIGNKWKRIRPNTTKQKVVYGLTVVIVSLLIWFIFKDLPSPTRLNSGAFPVSTQIFDRNGVLLYEIFADENRTPVALGDLPAHVAQATLAIEDQNFYHHLGFSLQGIARALRNNVFGQQLQGGSTITQQLVKTALLTPERTIQRKLREAVLTIGTELIYSKDDILEMYLNHIPYGGTAYGIEAAAQRFFGKNSKDLILSESAFLAGLPQAPTRYSPFTNPEQAKARQYEVLRRMFEDGYISQEEADIAFEKELAFVAATTDISAPHFVFYVKDLLEQTYGLQTVERGGLRVTTSLDLEIQDYAQASVAAEIDELEGYRVSNGAALVTKPNTGEILAMVGSRDFFNDEVDGKVNITTRLRQPGSSIKPINYVTAFQTGKLAPASILLDIPTCFLVTGQPLYCPKNYDNSHHGVVSVRSALASSYNIPAVKALAVNSLEAMIATASAMGISTFTDSSQYGLSLTLGGGEVTMLDMSTAFGTLANQGVKVSLKPILKVEDYQGNLLEEYKPEVTAETLSWFFEEGEENNRVDEEHEGLVRVLNREPAYMVSDIISDNVARSSAFGSNSELRIPDKTVAVKTGTTNDLRDNWTIGYTPELLVATWVGNNDNTPMNPFVVSGVTGAAPIWNSIMSFILEDMQDLPQARPENLETIATCTLTGTDNPDQPCQSRSDLFWTEHVPEISNITQKEIWINKDTGAPAFFPKAREAFAPSEIEIIGEDKLELRSHLVISDPFVVDFCLNCLWPSETNEDGTPKEGGRITYPIVNVNMRDFYSKTRSNN